MGEGAKQIFQGISLKAISDEARRDPWVIMEGCDDICESLSTGSSFEESSNSVASSSSSELVEDASSSTSSSLSSLSNGPLYELSELMVHLPIKRGLSNYFQGKSQSFTSLANVRSIEDLSKRVIPCRKKMKSCKSYGGGLDAHILYSPKATISKKPSRGYLLSSLSKSTKRAASMGVCRPPLPVQKN